MVSSISSLISSMVKPSNGDNDSEIRLIDDAFGNICNCIIDLSIRVRTEAAQLLGTMASVSLPVLLQTLDKRLMADMRVRFGSHSYEILLEFF